VDVKPSASSKPPVSAPSSSTVGKSVVPFKLADIGEGIAEVELLKWFVKKGDKVKSFDKICEVQSDKATVEITSRFDGIIANIHHDVGSIVKVGSTLIDIETVSSSSSSSIASKSLPAASSSVAASHHTPAASLSQSNSYSQNNNNKVLTTPSVRKIAKENNIDLSHITPTGPKGRITKEDVLLFIQGKSKPASAVTVAKQNSPSSSVSCGSSKSVSLDDRKVPIRGVQRLMVKSMTAANQVPHLTYCEEIGFDKIRKLRNDMKKQAATKGIKMSYMPLMLKATSLALLQFPQLNSTVNADCTELTYHANHNIGVAVDTPKGLVVPVIKEIQKKSIFEIAVALGELQVLSFFLSFFLSVFLSFFLYCSLHKDAAVKGTITESHLSGGTFTVSNIGSVGGTYAVPVLVVPQVIIGAFGRLQIVPRYTDQDGNPASVELIDRKVFYLLLLPFLMPVLFLSSGNAVVKPVTIMNVSWSADHRVVDGATVAKFSNLWKFYLENPHAMLSELR
jgi:2-oxoisovalerate dehydrogenase E2 component (dihydrolipoyl transacylase)